MKLSEAFLATAPEEARPRTAAHDALETTLQAIVARCRAAWPAIDADPLSFLRYVAARTPADPQADRALEAMHVEELWLTHACSLGDPVATAAFDQRFMGNVTAAVRRLGEPEAVANEVTQILRHKLFVGGGDDGPPRIAEYAGRGSLAGWLRASAVRTASNHVRGTRRRAHAERQVSRMPLPVTDPELDFIRAHDGEEFRRAFRAALDRLSTRDRGLLRMHYLDSLSLDHLAVVYRAHRSTVARWIAAARDQLFDEMRREVSVRLGLAPEECESLMNLVRSQLDLSLNGLMKDTPVDGKETSVPERVIPKRTGAGSRP